MAALSESLVRQCPVCAEYGTPVGSSWDLVECRFCRHVWSKEPQGNNDLYESDDYASWRVASQAIENRQLEMAKDRVAWLGSLPPGRVLEIGCSTGEAAGMMAEKGWETWGIDLSAPAVSLGKERYPSVELGVGITPADAGFPESGYDLLMGFHVVEHIEDLDAVSALARQCLTVGGRIYLRLPNWDSWSRRVFGDRWPDNMAEHVQHFSPGSMTKWLDASGFDIERLETSGHARSWVGGLRRAVSSDWNPEETMPTTGDRSQTLMSALDRIGRPLFSIEERFNGGAELVVLASKR